MPNLLLDTLQNFVSVDWNPSVCRSSSRVAGFRFGWPTHFGIPRQRAVRSIEPVRSAEPRPTRETSPQVRSTRRFRSAEPVPGTFPGLFWWGLINGLISVYLCLCLWLSCGLLKVFKDNFWEIMDVFLKGLPRFVGAETWELCGLDPGMRRHS